ncbi:MAG: sigma 54-interacting transcriptional regulator [Vicinamibacterales bacterium]
MVDASALSADDVGGIVERERAALVVLACGGQSDGQRIPMLRMLSTRTGAPPIVVAAMCESATDVNALLEHGARELIALPVNVAEAAGRLRAVLRECARASMVDVEHPVPGLVGSNEAFLAELRKIPVVAACEANVLIFGETGTGKELCAQAIHNASARRLKPFVPINCGAIPHDLIENELFGHERGAFTGASHGRPGLVQDANGGTLFLDEINSLPMSAQVKLLRVLQDGSFRPLGSNRVQHVDLRIVAASNEDLHAAVQDGRFRKDLYYRLNVIPIRLPALRERRDDIPRLAQVFVERYAERTGRRVLDLSQDALAKLAAHDWPGNVRELEHVIERAVVLASSSRLRARDLSLGADDSGEQNSFQEAKAKVVRDFERGYLRSVLSQCRGNISQAAVAAGKDRRAFWELMRKHEISSQEFRAEAEASHRRLAS